MNDYKRIQGLPESRQWNIICGMVYLMAWNNKRIDPSIITQYGRTKALSMVLWGFCIHLDTIFYTSIGPHYRVFFWLLFSMALFALASFGINLAGR